MAKIDWKKRAEKAEQALADVNAPKRMGRPPAPPRTPDGHVIADAIAALGCSRGQLAALVAKKLGESFYQSRLTSANRTREDGGSPLTADQVKAIEVITAAAKKKATR
jgi:hypothetical protein